VREIPLSLDWCGRQTGIAAGSRRARIMIGYFERLVETQEFTAKATPACSLLIAAHGRGEFPQQP